jgi:hypothetical protein
MRYRNKRPRYGCARQMRKMWQRYEQIFPGIQKRWTNNYKRLHSIPMYRYVNIRRAIEKEG